MNITSQLKTLPLISAIALGLVLSPTLSMADDGNRGRDKTQYSHDRGQSNKMTRNKFNNRADHRRETSKKHGNRYVGNANDKYRHDKKSHKYKSDHRYNGAHDNHRYHKHGNHNHHYTGHKHTNYLDHDHRYRKQYIDLDNLRFMFGLHTGNFDIIFRD